jgi:hypothetical protein
MPECGQRDLEVACQQILLTDASVYSVQWLDLPARFVPRVTASLLLEHYFKVVRECTYTLIRPTVIGEGVQFRIVGTSLSLLSFSPAQFTTDDGAEIVELCICGGILVQAGECDRGRFSLISAASDDGVRVTVQLSDYCPLLLGSRTPSKMRKHLYRLTQAYIHKVVTVRYLSSLYHELTGMKLRAKVKKVQVREGTET